MFERFTERARLVVVLAQDEARALKHNYIGREHLLLGLLREEEGLAARVLKSLYIGIEETRSQVARIAEQEVVTVSRAHELAQTVREDLPGGASHALDELERLAGEAERLRAALKAIAEGGLGDEPWFAGYDRIREFARAALEAGE